MEPIPFKSGFLREFPSRNLILGIMFLLVPLASMAQVLTLNSCLDSARSFMPLLRQQPLLQRKLQDQLSNYASLNLPGISAFGQGSYQSDVPGLPFKVPGFKGLNIPKDQYRVGLELDQPVYDGGLARARGSQARSQERVQEQQLDLNLNQYQRKIVETYFQSLLAQEQLITVGSTLSLLREKARVLESAIRNGTRQPNDLYEIQTEILRQERNQLSLSASLNSGLSVLTLMTGSHEKDSILAIPVPAPRTGGSLDANPTLKLLQAEEIQTRTSGALFHSERMPRISFFGQAGIGSPNPLNFFQSSSALFYQAGLRAQWSVWDWGTFRREQQDIRLEQGMQELQREQSLIDLKSQVSDISHQDSFLRDMQQKDDTILQYRARIRINASHQLDQGTITPTDYLDQVIQEEQARLQEVLDRIELDKNDYLLGLEQGNY